MRRRIGIRAKFQVNLFGRTVNVQLQRTAPSWVSLEQRNLVGTLDVRAANYRMWIYPGGGLKAAIDTWRHEFGHMTADVISLNHRMPHMYLEWFAEVMAAALSEYDRGVQLIKEAYRCTT